MKISVLFILMSTIFNGIGQITECELVFYNAYGKEIKDKSKQANLSPLSIGSGSAYKTVDGIPNYIIRGKIDFKADKFLYGYTRRNGYTNAYTYYDKHIGGYRKVLEEQEDEIVNKIEAGTTISEKDYVVGEENYWVVKHRERDLSFKSTVRFEITDIQKYRFEDPSLRCIAINSIDKNHIVGLWKNSKQRQLYFVVWNLQVNSVKKYKLADNFAGKSDMKSTGDNTLGILYNTWSDGDFSGIYFKEIDFVRTIRDNKLVFKADLSFKDLKRISLQDFLIDRRDNRVVAVLHGKGDGYGIIFLMQISQDRKSYKVSSADGLDPWLWSVRGANVPPRPINDMLRVPANLGWGYETNILIAQRQSPFNNYVVLLRPVEKKVAFFMPNSPPNGVESFLYSKRIYYMNNPTLVAFDTENLLPFSWDFRNLFNCNSGHSGYENPLSNYYFRDFHFSQSGFVEYVHFIENPKNKSGENTSHMFTFEVEKGSSIARFDLSEKTVKKTVKDVSKSGLWEMSEEISSGLKAVKKNGKWGFADASDNIVIPTMYEKVFSFKEGYDITAVKLGGKVGYINKFNKQVIPIKYQYITKIMGDMIRVKENDLYGFYNAKCELIYEPQFKSASDFREGADVVYTSVVSPTGDKGRITKTGKITYKSTLK